MESKFDTTKNILKLILNIKQKERKKINKEKQK